MKAKPRGLHSVAQYFHVHVHGPIPILSKKGKGVRPIGWAGVRAKYFSSFHINLFLVDRRVLSDLGYFRTITRKMLVYVAALGEYVYVKGIWVGPWLPFACLAFFYTTSK